MSAPTKPRKTRRGQTRNGRITPKNSMTALPTAIKYATDREQAGYGRGHREGYGAGVRQMIGEVTVVLWLCQLGGWTNGAI